MAIVAGELARNLPWMTTCAPMPSSCEQVGHCKAILGNLTLRAAAACVPKG
jgi:hypothetical protein